MKEGYPEGLSQVAAVLLLLFKSNIISSENANKLSKESELKTPICCYVNEKHPWFPGNMRIINPVNQTL